MKARFREVVGLLRTEAGICRDLLRAMEHERAAMLRSQFDPWVARVAEKEALIQRLHAVESQRQESVGRLAAQLGCETAELTVSRLVRTAPPAFVEALSGCRVELSELLERLRMQNRRNAMLARHTAELLRSFCGVIKGVAAHGPVYQSGGRIQAVRLNGKLLSHAT